MALPERQIAALERWVVTLLLVLPAFGVQAGVVFTSLHSFNTFPYGANPNGLILGSNGDFYGTTGRGGTNRAGTVFEISSNGALATLYSFTNASPEGVLTQGGDGDFYGVTYFGGADNDGAVFKITTNGALATLYSFTGGDDGQGPSAGLAQGSDGSFYGITGGGGTNNNGTVFKISAGGAFTSLYSFGAIKNEFGIALDGANPEGILTQGADGYFYGTTSEGGTNDLGTVFKITTNGALTSLYSFTNGDDGANPGAGLTQGGNGDLYGTTIGGGVHDDGTVFKITTNGDLTTIYAFGAVTNAYGDPLDGADPQSGLVFGGGGDLYGTAYNGGTNNEGTVFQITTSGALIGSYSLAGTNGANPQSGLVRGAGGYFYGTAYNGGTNNGTVFQLSASGVLATLYTFPGGNDGELPAAGLVQASDGSFYGTTQGNSFVPGNPPYGTVFKITTNGDLTTVYTFGTVIAPGGGAGDGADPHGTLVQGADGDLYGTTETGGTNGAGTVFKLSANGALTTLYSFSSYIGLKVLYGENPEAGLVQDGDGVFYGTTFNGGFDGFGTVFQISSSGEASNLYSFNEGGAGGRPTAGLAEGADGYLYGTSEAGGTNGFGHGAVFKMTTNGVMTNFYDFGAVTNASGDPLDGADPQAGLVLGRDGLFYGTTFSGGASGDGTVFKITTNMALTHLYSFTNGIDGRGPQAGLAQGSDGAFYGTTLFGGEYGYGAVFKITTNGALTALYSFTGGSDGGYPEAGLTQGSDGDFYGTTTYGGMGGAGTVFRLAVEPEFQAATLSGGKLILTWSTEAGARYQLQYTSDLSSGNWTNLESAVTATGATLTTIDPDTTAPQRFYRLKD